MFESSSTSCWRRWTVNLAYFIFKVIQFYGIFALFKAHLPKPDFILISQVLEDCRGVALSLLFNSSVINLTAVHLQCNYEPSGLNYIEDFVFHSLWTNPRAPTVEQEVHREGALLRFGLNNKLHKFISYETANSQVDCYASQKIRKQNRSPLSWLAYCWWVCFNH